MIFESTWLELSLLDSAEEMAELNWLLVWWLLSSPATKLETSAWVQ